MRYCRKHPHISFCHCFIHRQSLASKELSPELNEVMKVVVSVVNFIKANKLNSRLFAKLCRDQGAEFENLLFHTQVRWLSRGKVLVPVFILREEIYAFLISKGHEHAECFAKRNFVMRLAYLADMFELVNNLNLNLQGRNQYVFEMQQSVNGFLRKLPLIANRIENGNLENLPNVAELVAMGNDVTPKLKEQFCGYLLKLKLEFEDRFGAELTNDYSMVKLDGY